MLQKLLMRNVVTTNQKGYLQITRYGDVSNTPEVGVN